jgi:hypothetical protein
MLKARHSNNETIADFFAIRFVLFDINEYKIKTGNGIEFLLQIFAVRLFGLILNL